MFLVSWTRTALCLSHISLDLCLPLTSMSLGKILNWSDLCPLVPSSHPVYHPVHSSRWWELLIMTHSCTHLWRIALGRWEPPCPEKPGRLVLPPSSGQWLVRDHKSSVPLPHGQTTLWCNLCSRASLMRFRLWVLRPHPCSVPSPSLAYFWFSYRCLPRVRPG